MFERFRAAFDAMTDSFMLLDAVVGPSGEMLDFVCVECNQTALDRIGRPRDEVIGTRYTRLYPQALTNGVFARLHAVFATQQPFDGELAIEIPTVGSRRVAVRVVPNGAGIALTSKDVTEQRALQTERELHTTVLQNMNEGVVVVRVADAKIVFTNPKLERMLGFAPHELDDQPAISLAYDALETRVVISDAFRQILATGESTIDVDFRSKDGRKRKCRMTMSLTRDPVHGDVYLGVIADVTDQRRLEEERDGFFLLSLDMLCVASFDGRFRRLNPAWEHVLGWTVEELTGRPFIDYVHPDDRERTIAETAKLAAGGSTLAFENRYRCKDGSYRVLSWRSVPARSIDAIFASAHDVTDHRARETALLTSDAEKEVLLKEIHHRVKNNLQVVSSLLKVHSESIAIPEARAALQDSQDRVRSIALLHEKLYQSKHLGSVSMAEYAEGLAATLMRAHRSRTDAPRMIYDIAVDLPIDLAVPCGLILNEALTNSLKHAFVTPVTEPTIRVAMSEDQDGRITLAIADNGAGLPEDFDPSSAKTLGMHLIRTLARQLRGTVEIGSYEGTRCTIRFPRDPDKDS